MFGGYFTERNLPDAQSNLGLWGDGRGEDELSPEEIQMVCLSCVYLSILPYYLLYSHVVIKRSTDSPKLTFNILCRIICKKIYFLLVTSSSSGSS